MEATVRHIVAELSDAGRPAEAGWWLLGFVEPEWRCGRLTPETAALLLEAARHFDTAEMLVHAAELRRAVDGPGGAFQLCTPETVRAGTRAAF
jgi:hypothetical protein